MIQRMEGKFPLMCSENKRSPSAQMEGPFALYFPFFSLLGQTIAVILRRIFHRKAHK